MKCPLCNVDLVMSERQGVEIDYCPQCRGVWLDRGELDKIIERSAASTPAPSREDRYERDYDRRRDHDHDHGRDYDKRYDDYKKKKKKRPGSFLEDLFEFGD